MPKSDGSVTIDVRAKKDELKKDLKDVEKSTKSSAVSMGKEIEKIFSNASKTSGRAVSELKSDVAKLASEYQKKGYSISESYQKAFMDVISESAGAKSDLVKDADGIAEAFGESASESRQEYQKFFSDINNETSKVQSVYEKLSGTISKQESDLNSLKEKYRDVSLEQGKNSDEAKALGREIQELSGELKENKAKLNDAESAADKFDQSLDNVEKSSEQAKGGFSVLGGAIASFVGNILANAASKVVDFVRSIFELSEATEEYRQMMSKVSGSAESFGYSIDDARERYKEFYKYLGDDQMATNAITNLMGMRVNTQTLDNVVNGAIATWTAYGDSIPIESLTESITETVNVSKVTGTFADAINWATLSNKQWNSVLGEGSGAQKAFNKSVKTGATVEDAFSAALAATTDKQERAKIVANLLNETFGESKKTYDKLSGSILDANEAESELKETQAELGESLTPLNTKFTQLKTKALKAMAPMIEGIVESFSNLVDGINWDKAADMIGNVMSVSMKGLEWLLKNIKPVSTLVIGLGAAWLTYKGIMTGANAVSTICEGLMAAKAVATGAATVAVGAHTTATVAATAAQEAFNIAQMANPIGLVVGLAAGAVAAIAAFTMTIEDSTEVTVENTEETKTLIDEYKELCNQLDENKKSREESLKSTETEYLTADKMVAKLEELSKKENKSNGEKKLMKQYVDQLNEILPDLNLSYDEEKDKLNQSTEAIKKNIEASKELALAKASQKNLESIAEDLVNAEMEMAKATEKNTKNQNDYKSALEEKTKALEKWKETGYAANSEEQEAFMESYNRVEKLNQARKDSQNTLDDCRKKVDDLNESYNKTEEFAEKMLESADIEQALQRLTENCKRKGVEIPQSISEGIKSGLYALPESVEEMKALIEFSDLEEKASASGMSIPQKLSSGITSGSISPSEAVKQMNNLIEFNELLQRSEAAGKNVPSWLTNGILSGQYTPAQAVQHMKDLIEYSDLLQQANNAGIKVPSYISENILKNKWTPQKAAQEMKNLITFNDLLNKCEKAGINVPKEIKDGINSGKLSPSQAVDKMNALMEKEADTLEPYMGKTATKASGKYAKSIGSKKSDAKIQAKNLVKDAKLGAGSDDLYDEGNNAGSGFIQGIKGWFSGAWNAGWSLVKNAISGGKKAQRSNSPAKDWIAEGGNAGQGYTIGLERSERAVNKAASEMVRGGLSVIEGISKSMDLSNLFCLDNMKTMSFSGEAVVNFRNNAESFRGFDTSGLVASMQSRAFELSAKYNPVIEYENPAAGAEDGDIPVIIPKGGITVNAMFGTTRTVAQALAPDMDMEIGKIRLRKARGS